MIDSTFFGSVTEMLCFDFFHGGRWAQVDRWYKGPGTEGG